ncbi:MAG: type II toxin-antitoxin system VapC family toxin [Rhizobiales bacterium]|nr:type II toxin-antitoxin system VapC family toxin [Hyphomicrobiales bacterium]
MIVIDASVAVGWCFADEATPRGDAVLERVRAEGARVPSLWHLEVANVLRQAERRERISEAETSLRLELLAQLPIATDADTMQRAWMQTLALARTHTLTVYDAAYLELAARFGLPLASKDRELLAAARKNGIAVLAC